MIGNFRHGGKIPSVGIGKRPGKIPLWWEISLSGRKKVFRCKDHLVLRHPSYMRGFTCPFSLSVTMPHLGNGPVITLCHAVGHRQFLMIVTIYFTLGQSDTAMSFYWRQCSCPCPLLLTLMLLQVFLLLLALLLLASLHHDVAA
jgi:hypothetical protein